MQRKEREMQHKMIDPFVIWQPWFAWFPVYIENTLIWWEPVSRRLRMYGYDQIWEYDFPQTKQS